MLDCANFSRISKQNKRRLCFSHGVVIRNLMHGNRNEYKLPSLDSSTDVFLRSELCHFSLMCVLVCSYTNVNRVHERKLRNSAFKLNFSRW